MATISVTCQCGRRLRIAAEHAGGRARCPACGQALQVPYAEALSDTEGMIGNGPEPRALTSIPPRLDDLTLGIETGSGSQEAKPPPIDDLATTGATGIRLIVGVPIILGILALGILVAIPWRPSRPGTPPDNPQYLAYLTRGVSARLDRDWDKAITEFSEAIRIDPSRYDAFWNRGFAWAGKKEIDKAIIDYNEALRLDPTHAWIFNLRGKAWQSQEEHDIAITDFTEAIRLNPQDADAFLNRGSAWISKRSFDQAIADFNCALQIDPRYYSAFVNRGAAWSRKGDDTKAITDYNQAIRLNPQGALAFYNRGVSWATVEVRQGDLRLEQGDPIQPRLPEFIRLSWPR